MTVLKAMREAYEAELDKFHFVARKAMSREQIIEAALRAAVCALAEQFQDPVVRDALLWAAKESDRG